MSVILEAIEDQSQSGSGSYPGAYDDGYNITPYSRPFSVSLGGGSVTVTYNVDFEIFPLQYVDYVSSSGDKVRIPGITAMDVLPGPSAAPHVFKMREDTKSSFNFTLTVYSHDETLITDEDGNSYLDITNYVTSFAIIIIANYNTNRDKLVAAVNTRRT